MGSPGGLISRGWRRTELRKGDVITVEGFGAKDGRNTANATRLVNTAVTGSGGGLREDVVVQSQASASRLTARDE